VVAGFVWIHRELSGAISPDVSSFLLIIFYVAYGLVLIFAGRRHAVGLARGAGLALVFLGGFKALMDAGHIEQVALRVAVRVLVSALLFAVAYWYRGGSGAPARATGE
jgi:hypothetical protein